MYGKISTQSKVFIVLFVIALFGTFVCLNLSYNLITVYSPGQTAYSNNQAPAQQTIVPAPVATVDTSDWKTYENKEFGFSFLYKPDWKVLSKKQIDGYTVIQVDPGLKFYNIKIYVSPKGYYQMDGLPTQNVTIGGKPGVEVNNLLYGVQSGNNYFTFDVGLSTSLKPNFDALVNSVQFTNAN